MCRLLPGIFSTLVLLIGVLAVPARADDTETCKKWVGDDALAACTRLISTQRGGDRARGQYLARHHLQPLQGRLGSCHRRLRRSASTRFEGPGRLRRPRRRQSSQGQHRSRVAGLERMPAARSAASRCAQRLRPLLQQEGITSARSRKRTRRSTSLPAGSAMRVEDSRSSQR